MFTVGFIHNIMIFIILEHISILAFHYFDGLFTIEALHFSSLLVLKFKYNTQLQYVYLCFHKYVMAGFSQKRMQIVIYYVVLIVVYFVGTIWCNRERSERSRNTHVLMV